MSIYLYGVVRAQITAAIVSPANGFGAGVGEPPRRVELIAHGELAALVSEIPAAQLSSPGVGTLRRNIKAHADVLNRLVAAGVTVLPFRFGVAMPDARSVVQRLLGPQQAALLAYLQRLEGAVEITFKASYVEDRILQEVVAEQPQLVSAGRSPASRAARAGRAAYQSRIDLGRRVASAIQAKRQRDAQWLIAELRRFAREVKINQPAADGVVLHASFLVPRSGITKFDRALEAIARQAQGRMKIDCVGPLPPHSFVDLRL